VNEGDVLGELLAAEHQAIWAYGVLGAHLAEQRRVMALSAYDAHRALRNTLLLQLQARHLPTPGPELSYALTVTTPRSAVQQAISLEEGLSVRWRDLVSVAGSAEMRRLAVQGLSAAAVRATRWRQVLGTQPLTVPFPGQV
jgi:hypothetical protein